MSELLDVYRDTRLDQSDALYLTIPATSRKRDLLVADAELEVGGVWFYIGEVGDDRDGTGTTPTVEAPARWMRLGEVVRPGSIVLTTLTPSAGLEAILAGHVGTAWTVGSTSTGATATYSMEEQDASTLQYLRTWAKVTGTRLEFDTALRTVALRPAIAVDRGVSFRYGRNLTGVRRRVRPPAATVLYMYGAQDLSIAGVNGGLEYLEDFTFYTDQGITLSDARARFTRSRIIADPAFVDEDALLAAAEELIAELAQPIITYELTVVDLTELTGAVESIVVGDTVRVFDPDFGEDIATTVVRYEQHYREPWRNVVELAFNYKPAPDGSADSRPDTAVAWEQFIQNNVAEQNVRNDQTYYVNRLPLTFRPGGRVNLHLDITGTGVGDGVVTFEVVAGVGGLVLHPPYPVAYTDGNIFRASTTFALEELEGSFDFRVRVSTVADGGPSVSLGVVIAEDELRFYAMAQGAVRETPVVGNSLRFDVTNSTNNVALGATQTWQVPDGVTEVTAEVVGASGASFSGTGGGGASLVVSFPVTPGELLDIDCGRRGQPWAITGTQVRAWPNGGAGSGRQVGDPSTPSNGPGGGASSAIRRNGFSFANSLAVAAGGGGGGEDGGDGGAGAVYVGGDGTGFDPGFGATQFAGGAAALIDPGNDPPAVVGAFNYGGDGARDTSALSNHGGGGGGGWYGGGGSGRDNGSNDTGGGGGGSSMWDASVGVVVVSVTDGANAPDAEGYVVLSWETPA